MIDLHLHLDGALRPETVLDLAKQQGVILPAADEEGLLPFLRVPEDCSSLEDYLKRFALPLSVLQEKDAIARVVFETIEDAQAEGVEYAEIRFAPQLSTEKGLSQEEVVEGAIQGLERGQKEFPGFRGGLILCCMRAGDNREQNLKTVDVAKKYLGKGVCAVDLAGAESLFPTEDFEEIFVKARALEIPFTIHAGEAAGPESIKKALEFGTKRIGHGIRAIEDEALLDQLVREKITLEVCVTSNIHIKAVADAYSHPVRKLFDRGVRVTINTDNRAISNITLKKEHMFLKEAYGFTEEELATMTQYAREAAFVK